MVARLERRYTPTISPYMLGLPTLVPEGPKLNGKTVGGRINRRCILHDVAAEMLLELRAALLNSDYATQTYGLSREQCARIRALIIKAGGVAR